MLSVNGMSRYLNIRDSQRGHGSLLRWSKVGKLYSFACWTASMEKAHGTNKLDLVFNSWRAWMSKYKVHFILFWNFDLNNGTFQCSANRKLLFFGPRLLRHTKSDQNNLEVKPFRYTHSFFFLKSNFGAEAERSYFFCDLSLKTFLRCS